MSYTREQLIEMGADPPEPECRRVGGELGELYRAAALRGRAVRIEKRRARLKLNPKPKRESAAIAVKRIRERRRRVLELAAPFVGKDGRA